MGLAKLIDAIANRAPAIIIITFIAALVLRSSNAPSWIANSLAGLVGVIAVLVWVSGAILLKLKSKEQLGFTRNRDAIAWDFLGKGMPKGYLPLGILGMATVLLTGFQPLAFTGLVLVIAWGSAKRRYPADLNNQTA